MKHDNINSWIIFVKDKQEVLIYGTSRVFVAKFSHVDINSQNHFLMIQKTNKSKGVFNSIKI